VVRISSWASAGIASVGLAVPALAGNVLTVGGAGGSFADIQSAVVAAADDDVILVRAGTYPGFVIEGKSLAVVADTGAIVDVDSQVVVRNVSSGHRVVLAGLRVVRPGTNTTSFLDAVNVLGSLRLISCELGRSIASSSGPTAQNGVSLLGCADVAIVGCTLQGRNGPAGVYPSATGGSGLEVHVTQVAVYDSRCTGGDGGTGLPGEVGGNGGTGCALFSGATFLFASGSTFEGGDGADGFSATSCLDPAASDGGPGGDGIRNLFGSFPTVALLDTNAAGGSGGAGGSDACGPHAFDGSPGSPIDLLPGSVFTQLAGTARRAAMRVPVREATVVPVVLTGVPGELAYLTEWNDAGFLYIPLYGGVRLERAPLLRRIPMGIVPPSGTLASTLTIPSLPPGIQARTYFLQAYFVDPTNAVRLGSAFGQVVLDSSF